jgi:hypothetical protein
VTSAHTPVANDKIVDTSQQSFGRWRVRPCACNSNSSSNPSSQPKLPQSEPTHPTIPHTVSTVHRSPQNSLISLQTQSSTSRMRSSCTHYRSLQTGFINAVKRLRTAADNTWSNAEAEFVQVMATEAGKQRIREDGIKWRQGDAYSSASTFDSAQAGPTRWVLGVDGGLC